MLHSTDNVDPGFWRRRAIFFATLSGGLSLALAILLFMASQDSTTHWNLGYVMWKNGMRNYDSATALGGLFHDKKFRKSLIGISESNFQEIFPNTFYEIQSPPPIAKPGQHWFIEGYAESKRPDGGGPGWHAVFENGKLVEIDYFKG